MASIPKTLVSALYLLGFILILFSPRFFDHYLSVRKEFTLFKEALKTKELNLRRISHQRSTDVQDEARATLLQNYLNQNYLRTLKSQLTTKPEQISSLPHYLVHGVGVFIAKGNRSFFQSGNDFEKILGENWFRHFLLSMKQDGKLWIKRQALFAVPPYYGNFLKGKSQWYWTIRSSKTIYFTFHELGNYRIVFMVDPENIYREDYLNVLSYQLKQKYSSLQLQISTGQLYRDQFNFMGFSLYSKAVPLTSLSLQINAKTDPIYADLKTCIIWFFGLCILWYLVRRNHHFHLLSLRFGPKFLILWMLYCSLCLLCFSLLFETTISRTRNESYKDWEKSTISKILETESKYWDWLQDYVDLVKSDLPVDEIISKLKEFNVNYVYFMDDYTIDQQVFSDNMLVRQFMFKNGIRNLLFHKYYGVHDTDQIAQILPVFKEVYDKYRLSETISTDSPTDLYTQSINEIHIKSSATDKVALSRRKSAQGYRIVDFDLDAWSKLMSSDKPNEIPELLVATLSRDEGVRRFFNKSQLNFKGSHLYYFSKTSGHLVPITPSNESINSISNELFHQLANSINPKTEVLVDGTIYQVIFQPSTIVGGASFLCLTKDQLIQNNVFKLESNHRQFILVFLGLSCLLFFYLCINVLIPTQRLRNAMAIWKSGKTPSKTSFYGLHEGSRLTRHFDQFMEELHERDKMLPFLSRTLLRLFQDPQSTYQAVILFSDIQGFTSFCEVHDSQEVVDLLNEYFSLWDKATSKFGGVTERYVGDAVEVIFFEKLDSNFIQSSIECALKLKQQLQDFNNKRLANSKTPIQCGIALKLCNIQLEVIGNDLKKEFFSYSSGVFECEDMEKHSRIGKSTQVVVDEEIFFQMKDYYDFEKILLQDKKLIIYEVQQ